VNTSCPAFEHITLIKEFNMSKITPVLCCKVGQVIAPGKVVLIMTQLIPDPKQHIQRHSYSKTIHLADSKSHLRISFRRIRANTCHPSHPCKISEMTNGNLFPWNAWLFLLITGVVGLFHQKPNENCSWVMF
jgi:hypothetical protein